MTLQAVRQSARSAAREAVARVMLEREVNTDEVLRQGVAAAARVAVEGQKAAASVLRSLPGVTLDGPVGDEPDWKRGERCSNGVTSNWSGSTALSTMNRLRSGVRSGFAYTHP